MRAFLESIAPLNNAERITSRLMVVQGANDPRVPVTESRQVVERVRGDGLDVAYIEGANEGHGFRDPWNSLYAGLAQRGGSLQVFENIDGVLHVTRVRIPETEVSSHRDRNLLGDHGGVVRDVVPITQD